MTQIGSTDQWTHTIQPIIFPNDQYTVEVGAEDDLGYAYKSISILIMNLRPQIQIQNVENNSIITRPNNFTLDIAIVYNEGDIFSNASIMIYDSNSNPQEYEKGIDWELTMNFIEYDKYSRNEKIRKIKQILKPSELEEFEQGKRFEEKIPKEKVDTEWGYEEVLVELNLEPIQKPNPDSRETNKVNIKA